jgi:CheY-like chemotaxis protein
MDPTRADGGIAVDVLVVEDEPAVATLMTSVLEDLNYRVAVARDGVEALEQVESVRPRLIVTDLAMPRMGGLELMQRLRERGAETPVIVVSARMDMAREVAPLQPAGMLRKPFDLDEFEKVVSEQLDPSEQTAG